MCSPRVVVGSAGVAAATATGLPISDGEILGRSGTVDGDGGFLLARLLESKLASKQERKQERNQESKDLGDTSYILGIEIYRDRSRRLIGLSQST